MAQITFLGDSNFQGYFDEEGRGGCCARLFEKIERAYPRKYGYTNLSQDGDRTIDAKHHLGNAITRGTDILIISVGTNDIIRWGDRNGMHDQHAEARQEAWFSVLKNAKKHCDKVLIVSFVPVDEEKMPFKGFAGKKLYYRNDDQQAYAREIAMWAEEFSIPVLNVWQDWMDYGPKNLLSDGVHYNAKGHQMLADAMFKKCEELNYLGEQF